MMFNEIKSSEIPCLSFLKGTDYAMYVGPELTPKQRELLESDDIPVPVIYLPEILNQLTDPVVRYNFPGVDMTESLNAENIYSKIRAGLEGTVTEESRLVLRYEGDDLLICDVQDILTACDVVEEVRFRISDANQPIPSRSTKRLSQSASSFSEDEILVQTFRNLSLPIHPIQGDIIDAVQNKLHDELQDELQELEAIIGKLLLKGCPPKLLLSMINKSVKISRLKITRQLRIFLTDYDNMEIKMGPLPKTIFLFYLRHPEGVMFTHLQDYRDELMTIYSHVCRNDDPQKMKESIDRLVDPLDNSINEKCSSVRKAFVMNIEDSIAENYYISGPQGDKKRIHLDRALVEWECEL